MAIQSAALDFNPGAVKLDADLYQVEDIHGITEGLSGSGNLNYLVLQSGQTDEIRRDADPFNMREGNLWFSNGAAALTERTPQSIHTGAQGGDASGILSDGRAGGIGVDLQNARAISELSHGNAGSPHSYNSAVEHQENVPNFRGGGSNELNSLIERLGNGTNGTSGANGADGKSAGAQDGRDGHDGNDGHDGRDGRNGTGDPGPGPGPGDNGGTDPGDTDLHADADTPIGSVTLDVLLDPVEQLVGDIDINAGAQVSLAPLAQGHLPTIGVNADALLLGTHLGINTTTLTNPVTNSVNTLLDTLDPIINPVLNPVMSPLPQPLTDLINGFNGDGDTDLAINPAADLLGLPIAVGGIAVPLDPVESLLGDIDLNLNPALGVLGGGHPVDLGLNGVFNGQAFDFDLPGATGPLADLLAPLDGLGDHGAAEAVNGLIDDLDAATGLEDTLDDALDPAAGLLDDVQSGAAGLTGHILQPVVDIAGSITGDVAQSVTDTGVMDHLDHFLTPLADMVVDFADQAQDHLSGTANDTLADLHDTVQDVTPSGSDIVGAVQDAVDSLVEHVVDASGGVTDPQSILAGLTQQAAELLTGDPVEGIHGGLDDVAAGGIGSIGDILTGGSPNGDTDLTFHTGIDAAGTMAEDLGGAVTLDPVEAIAGDIDIDVDLGANALGHASALGADAGVAAHADPMEGLLNDLANSLLNDGGTQGGANPLTPSLSAVTVEAGAGLDAIAGLPSSPGGAILWPEAGIGDGLSQAAVNTATGLGQTANNTVAAALPDPVGHVSEGLSAVVDHSHATVHHALGGLFG